MAVAGMGTPSRNWPRGILIGLPGSYIRETTGCLALDFSDFDTSALGFGGFVFF